MRISDWSSDVCSSDLAHRFTRGVGEGDGRHAERRGVEISGSSGVGSLHLLRKQPDEEAGDGVEQPDEHQRHQQIEAGMEVHGLPGKVRIEPRQPRRDRSEEHTSELQSLMRISYAVFCLKNKNIYKKIITQ